MKSNKIKPLYRHPAIVVAPCKFGHGVFTTEPISADTTIEECHHLRIKHEDCTGIIDDYVFGLEDQEAGTTCYSLPLGWGCIFNHSYKHNTAYWHDLDRDLIVFYTIKDVPSGTQLFVNYGKEWWETRELKPKRAVEKLNLKG